MNLKRILGLLALSSSMLLAACGGGGAPTTTSAASAPTSSGANDYTGPAPATSDVQNFSIYLWQNIRGSNR
jgi:ABC-type glycerol-3-phosphate transport system substrate-binding protein